MIAIVLRPRLPLWSISTFRKAYQSSRDVEAYMTGSHEAYNAASDALAQITARNNSAFGEVQRGGRCRSFCDEV